MGLDSLPPRAVVENFVKNAVFCTCLLMLARKQGRRGEGKGLTGSPDKMAIQTFRADELCFSFRKTDRM